MNDGEGPDVVAMAIDVMMVMMVPVIMVAMVIVAVTMFYNVSVPNK